MIEELAWLIGPFLDIGNVIFFLASLRQMINSYRKRKGGLDAISNIMLLGYILASLFFVGAGYLSGGYITVVLGSSNIIFWSLSLYWKWKYRCQKK